MDSQMMIMRTGAGRYMQGEHAAARAAGELRRLGYQKVGVIAGRRAFEAASPDLLSGFASGTPAYEVSFYSGYCTRADIDERAAWASQGGFDCLLGVGGGKMMDFTKAVGAKLSLPVFTLPTIAATCAAFAPLSVVYDGTGHQQGIIFHEDSVAGVFVDLSILAKAPVRYLAAGIADAYAKSCEYMSMRADANYGDIDFGRYIGAKLALQCDEVLHQCARQACADNASGVVSKALSDAVSCVIGVVGVISGFGSYAAAGGKRFAIAHGFNEVIRARYVPDPWKYLHGEIVGVGILAQLRANGVPYDRIVRLESLFRDLSLPTRLSEIDMDYDDEQFQVFLTELLSHCRVEESCIARVTEAVNAVR